jgi:hypothetical protein
MEKEDDVAAVPPAPARFLYTGYYVRPLNFFTGNAYNEMLAPPKELAPLTAKPPGPAAAGDPDEEGEGEEEEEEEVEEEVPDDDDAAAAAAAPMKNKKNKKKKKEGKTKPSATSRRLHERHLHSCVVTQIFTLVPDALEEFVDIYLDPEQAKTTALASLSFPRQDGGGGGGAPVEMTVYVNMLRLALDDLVFDARKRRLTRAELLALLRPLVNTGAPVAMVNWIVNFAKESTIDDYINMCRSLQEPNWMHATLADIAATRGIASMDSLLNNAAIYALENNTVKLDGYRVAGTPAMFYANIYASPVETPSISVSTLHIDVRPFHFIRLDDDLVNVFRALFTDNTEDSPLMETFAWLRNYVGSEKINPRTNKNKSLFQSLIAATPFSLTSYVDTVCLIYFYALVHGGTYSQNPVFTSATTNISYFAPMLMGRNGLLAGSAAQVQHSLAAPVAPITFPLAFPSSLSALIHARYLPYALHGTVVLQ